ncbi:type I-F CRISPR-associated protein Csy2 [Comamonas sp. NoAH]|uniref:type I-F CRISPR-associated protein Csy2 n=1 Tax=Comamonas halotolerans TaxID=3041496 RepID=UPI0024E0B620|nr:type I-F CRISPR-associated protein Csy2 [Comamonas sp. NoAH]
MIQLQPQAILVLPHLRVQNANAISSPLTHGFPSITAFIGLMWALQRKLAHKHIPLKLLSVGVVCHHHQEQVSEGYVRTFNLTRNPVDKDGSTAAIVEEGRMHMQVSLVFGVALQPGAAASELHDKEQREAWAKSVGEIAEQMRVAGGSLLPSRPAPGKKVRPWMDVIAEDNAQQKEDFRRWRRQWLPGFALVSRDDVLAQRLEKLRNTTQPQATLLDAWLHAARFNYEAQAVKDGEAQSDGKVEWKDPFRQMEKTKGSGWLVPIPVGYAALGAQHAAGTVGNARDMTAPLRFVESVYSIGAWLSPHRIERLQDLLWQADTDAAAGLYRCRNTFHNTLSEHQESAGIADDDWDEEDDDYVDD